MLVRRGCEEPVPVSSRGGEYKPTVAAFGTLHGVTRFRIAPCRGAWLGTRRRSETAASRDEHHAWQALAYVERNPVRAALVEQAEEYAWSTAAAHCREDALEGRLDVGEWRQRYTGERWREVLRTGVREEAMGERIREATRRGCPLGSEAFVERIGSALGRDLRPRPPGRPAQRLAALTLPETG